MAEQTPRAIPPSVARTENTPTLLDRRAALRMLGGGLGAAILAGASASEAARAASCTQSPAMTQGPYWVEDELHRADIRASTSGKARPQAGAPLTLTLQMVGDAGGGCAPEAGVRVDIWHANALGEYSDVPEQGTAGQDFLRGYQVSDREGRVTFTTIVPGWYPSRTPHIHVRVRRIDGAGNVTHNSTTQLFFAQDAIAAIYAGNAPYNTRRRVRPDTPNTDDGLYVAALEVPLTASGPGYAGNMTLGLPLVGAGN